MEPLRLAVVSTPRSGNCWLRHMLAEVLELNQIAVHAPTEVNWNALAPRVVVQLHWLPEEPFVSLLGGQGFRVVVLARHPLDVLISILVFSQHDDSTLRWLDGAAGDERCLAGAAPLDEAFLEYATGPRAAALLDVSAKWWQVPGVCRVRYDDLLNDPAGQLAAILRTFGLHARKPPTEVAAKSTPTDIQAQNVHMLFHVWQAKTDPWRQFLPAPTADRIWAAHRAVFETLDYACEPEASLSAAKAQANWERFDASAAKRHLHGVKHTCAKLQARQYEDFHAQQAVLARQQAELDRQHVALEHQQLEIERQRTLLAEFAVRIDDLFPRPSGAARIVQRLGGRFVRVAVSVPSRLAAVVSRAGASTPGRPKNP